MVDFSAVDTLSRERFRRGPRILEDVLTVLPAFKFLIWPWRVYVMARVSIRMVAVWTADTSALCNVCSGRDRALPGWGAALHTPWLWHDLGVDGEVNHCPFTV